MGRVNLDGEFLDHPKIVRIGPLASWLHVCGLVYCARHLTDGFIPRGVVSRLADFSDVTFSGEPVNLRSLVDSLVSERVWEAVEGGYRIHDYLDYNPSKADVERERDQDKERQRRFRERHNGVHTGVTNAVMLLEDGVPIRGKAIPKPPPPPLIESHREEVKNALRALQSMKGYPFDKKQDYLMLERLVGQFGADVVFVTISAWILAKTTEPLTKRHNPRLQIHNWCEVRFKNKETWGVRKTTAPPTGWNGQRRNGARPKVSDVDEFDRDAEWLARAREGGV